MNSVFTSTDMRHQLQEVLDACEGTYDAEKIIDALQAQYGTVSIDAVPVDEFWQVVLANAND
jgi:hypothetical protein